MRSRVRWDRCQISFVNFQICLFEENFTVEVLQSIIPLGDMSLKIIDRKVFIDFCDDFSLRMIEVGKKET